MKVGDVRKLIGKRVQWETPACPHRGTYSVRKGTVIDVRRKNVLIEQGGSQDWRWLPDMIDLKEEQPAAAAPTAAPQPESPTP